jgi:hypothetical protein
VFEAGFLEGQAAEAPDNASVITLTDTDCKAVPPCSRRLVLSTDAFELFHVVLYYVYTRTMCFGVELNVVPDEGVPPVCDPQHILAIADRYELHDLRKHALEFLDYTRSKQNIVDRIFSAEAFLCDDVAKMYRNYFVENWAKIKGDDTISECLKGERGSARTPQILDRFLELTRRLDPPTDEVSEEE